jgi:hypothetical protein
MANETEHNKFIKHGVHLFQKNIGATSKFQVPDGCHGTNSILGTHKYLAQL